MRVLPFGSQKVSSIFFLEPNINGGRIMYIYFFICNVIFFKNYNIFCNIYKYLDVAYKTTVCLIGYSIDA
jgi:hypothetical protein